MTPIDVTIPTQIKVLCTISEIGGCYKPVSVRLNGYEIIDSINKDSALSSNIADLWIMENVCEMATIEISIAYEVSIFDDSIDEIILLGDVITDICLELRYLYWQLSGS